MNEKELKGEDQETEEDMKEINTSGPGMNKSVYRSCQAKIQACYRLLMLD